MKHFLTLIDRESEALERAIEAQLGPVIDGAQVIFVSPEQRARREALAEAGAARDALLATLGMPAASWGAGRAGPLIASASLASLSAAGFGPRALMEVATKALGGDSPGPLRWSLEQGLGEGAAPWWRWILPSAPNAACVAAHWLSPSCLALLAAEGPASLPSQAGALSEGAASALQARFGDRVGLGSVEAPSGWGEDAAHPMLWALASPEVSDARAAQSQQRCIEALRALGFTPPSSQGFKAQLSKSVCPGSIRSQVVASPVAARLAAGMKAPILDARAFVISLAQACDPQGDGAELAGALRDWANGSDEASRSRARDEGLRILGREMEPRSGRAIKESSARWLGYFCSEAPLGLPWMRLSDPEARALWARCAQIPSGLQGAALSRWQGLHQQPIAWLAERVGASVAQKLRI